MKLKYYLGVFIVLFLLSCSSKTNESNKDKEQHIPIFENCKNGELYSYKDKREFYEQIGTFNREMVHPLKYDYYPRIKIYDKEGIEIYPEAYDVKQIDSLNFMTIDEINELMTIDVDTGNLHLHELRDSSLQKQYCFKATPILFKNNSTNKYFLQDRFIRTKFILQAKNDKNEWMELHDIRADGCGLERMIYGKSTLEVLPPAASLKLCFINEIGDFETECRIMYMYYNSITEKGKHKNRVFSIRELDVPIFSNTFRQKISKERLRKAKKVF